MNWISGSFTVLNSHTVGDKCAYSGSGITGGAPVTAWDGSNATVRLTFTRPFRSSTYAVAINIFDTDTGLPVNEIPSLWTKTVDYMDMKVGKKRRIDFSIISAS